jgi:hypothetical protein
VVLIVTADVTSFCITVLLRFERTSATATVHPARRIKVPTKVATFTAKMPMISNFQPDMAKPYDETRR